MRRIGFGWRPWRSGCSSGPVAPSRAARTSGKLVEEELARFRGTWQLVSAETDGVKAPKDRTDKIRVVIEGSRHTVIFGDQEVVHSVPFAVDPTTTPKSVTDTLVDGPDKGKQIKGIYKLEGDTMTSCVAKVGEDRPAEFASKPGSGHTLRVFRRVKARTMPGRRRSRRSGSGSRAPGGTNRVVEGQEVPEEGSRTARLIVKGDRFEMTDPAATYRGTYTVDPSVTPKTIDVTFTEGPEAGKTSRGIYELDGDTYKVCVGLAGRDRPEEFASKPGSGHALQVLRREKP